MGVAEITCPLCRGKGKIWQVDPSPIRLVDKGISCMPPPRMEYKVTCTECYGVGTVMVKDVQC